MLLQTKYFPESNLGRRAFSFYGPRQWNCLPVSLRCLDEIGSFKSQLKTYLFSNFTSFCQGYNKFDKLLRIWSPLTFTWLWYVPLYHVAAGVGSCGSVGGWLWSGLIDGAGSVAGWFLCRSQLLCRVFRRRASLLFAACDRVTLGWFSRACFVGTVTWGATGWRVFPLSGGPWILGAHCWADCQATLLHLSVSPFVKR